MPEIGMFLKDDDPKEWIPYSDGEVYVKSIDLETSLRLERQCTFPIRGSRSGKKEQLNAVLYNMKIIDIAVLDWRGFREGGKPIPFSKETVKKYAKKNIDFAIFITDAATNLQKYLSDEKEESEKNSETTSGKVSSTEG